MNWYTICVRHTAYDAPKCVEMLFFGNAVVSKQQAKVTANSVIKRFVQSQQNLAFTHVKTTFTLITPTQNCMFLRWK